jgi:hypothetical protein
MATPLAAYLSDLTLTAPSVTRYKILADNAVSTSVETLLLYAASTKRPQVCRWNSIGDGSTSSRESGASRKSQYSASSRESIPSRQKNRLGPRSHKVVPDGPPKIPVRRSRSNSLDPLEKPNQQGKKESPSQVGQANLETIDVKSKVTPTARSA